MLKRSEHDASSCRRRHTDAVPEWREGKGTSMVDVRPHRSPLLAACLQACVEFARLTGGQGDQRQPRVSVERGTIALCGIPWGGEGGLPLAAALRAGGTTTHDRDEHVVDYVIPITREQLTLVLI